MTRNERWEQALAALHLLELYRFTGTIRFSMIEGKVSVKTLSRLGELTAAVQSSPDITAESPQPREEAVWP